jgi:hypothetical protein
VHFLYASEPLLLGSLKEEAGIEAPLEHAGTFLFLLNGAKWAFQIEIYRADSYTGIPTEWVTKPSAR